MRSLLLTGLLTLAFCASGQDSIPVFRERLNVVKLGVSSSLFKTLSFSYERVLNKELSVALTASYIIPKKPSGLLDLQTNDIKLSSSRTLTGWFLTPEVKWYLEDNDIRPAPRGFYLGAYTRFSNMRLTADLTAEATDGSGTVDGNLQVDLSEFGLGIEAGYQVVAIKDRLAIDIVFFGPRWSLYSLKVKADINGDGALAEDLQQALENALGRDVVPIHVDLDTNGSTSSTTSSFGYRAGFKVGYCF